MKDWFENINKKKNKEMKKFHRQEGVEVPKREPGQKKKATHPSAVIPAIPEGVTEDTYTDQRKRTTDEWSKKSNKDYNLIKDLMNDTYPMRRREILTKNLRVWEILDQFPNFASKSGGEVCFSYE